MVITLPTYLPTYLGPSIHNKPQVDADVRHPHTKPAKMVDWKGLFVKAYWTFAGLGMIWAVFIGSLISPTLQRQYVVLYIDLPFLFTFFLSPFVSFPPQGSMCLCVWGGGLRLEM